jgi:transcriptional regulator with XRE-family HTH domain
VSIRIRKKTQVQMEFGKRLKAKRQEMGLTQEQLAEKASLTYSYLGSIERGERNVSLGNIVALAQALMVSPKDLIPNLEQQDRMKEKIELGKKLKSKRVERGLTHQELALKTNLEALDIQLFERGEGVLNFDTLVALAKALKISLKDLVPETGF